MNQKDSSAASQRLNLLSEIGLEILSLLSVEQINEHVYDDLNKLMDADVFGIGIYDREKNDLEFSAIIESGKKIPLRMSLSEKSRPACWCFLNKKILLINDLEKDYQKYFSMAPPKKAAAGGLTQSIIYYPLIFKEKLLGVITVQSFKPMAYSEADVDVLKNLSVYISTAISNAQEVIKQKEEIQTAYDHIKFLDEIGQEITSTLNFEKIFIRLHSSIERLMHADVFGIRLYHEATNEVEVKYEVLRGKRDDGFSFTLENKNNYTAWAIEHRKEVFMNDQAKEYSNYIGEMFTLSGEYSASLIFCPMIHHNKVLGVVTVQSYEKNKYTKQHLNIIKTLANYAAVALENAEKFERVKTLNKKIEESFQNIKVLTEIGQKITSTLNLDKILDIVYDNVNQLMDATEFGVAIMDDEKNAINVKYYIFEGKRVYDSDMWVPLESENRLSVWSIKNKKEVFISDIEKDYSGYISNLDAYRDKDKGVFLLGSLIFLPLIIEDKVVGGLSVQSPHKNAYSEIQVEMFRTLASYTAVALNNADAYLKLNRSKRQLDESLRNIKVISEIGQKITATLDFERVLRTVYDNVTLLMDAGMFAVFSFDGKNRNLTYEMIMENGKEVDVRGKSFSMDKKDSFAGWCVRNDKEIIISNYEEERDKYVEGPRLKMGNVFSHSLIYLPLRIEKRVIGVLSVQSIQVNAYTNQNVEVLRTLAAYAAIALDNAMVYKQLDSALHEVEKLSVVASKTNNSVIICNPDTEIVWVNEAFTKNFGYLLNEIREELGKTLIEISGNKEIEEHIETCKITRQSVIYESFKEAKDGSKLWFHTTLTPVFDEDGTLRNIVAIDADISSIKKVEEELLQKNKDITDSINYARRIQNSILPSREKVKKLLPESFVYHKPRDIVSGDYFWIENAVNSTKVIVTVIDCTGHGVPGAFLTIVGNSLLNQIIMEQGVSDPRKIIIQMNKGLIKRLSFSQHDGVRDGMDMSVCLIDRQEEKETKLVYAGAFNPMYYFKSGEIKESVPARFSIGSLTDTEAENIFNETITVNKGDMLYLFTDGYADQLGEVTGKKFLKGRFKQLLSTVYNEDMKTQKAALEKKLSEWKGNLRQTDDVLVIGLRV